MSGKKDFNIGYSPERINPGDKVNTVKTIVKLVAGDTIESRVKIKSVYDKIIIAGTFEGRINKGCRML